MELDGPLTPSATLAPGPALLGGDAAAATQHPLWGVSGRTRAARVLWARRLPEFRADCRIAAGKF